MSKSFPKAIQRLILAFSALPSIGEKSATRLVFHLIRSPDGVARELAEAAQELKQNIQYCSNCRNIADTALCPVCTDSSRDQAQICLVAEPLDALAFERAGMYRGVYHVLHGLLDPLAGIGPDQLTIADLLTRLDSGGIREIILGLSPSTEGEATAMYLTKALNKFPNLKITRIARGLPTGSELSYADEITIAAAFAGRRDY